jgi:hypothetical protein
MALKFVFPPARPNSSSGAPRPNPIYKGLEGAPAWRENAAGKPCRGLEPKKHKHFPSLRLTTTFAAATTPRRDGPLPPVGTHSSAAYNLPQTLATSPALPTVGVHPLPPPLLPPSPPRSHLARKVFGYFPR